MKILITGTSSGLGKYLSEQLECDRFNRNNYTIGTHYDVIVHCAFNSKNVVPQAQLNSYIDDNVFLTKTLLTSCTSTRFVFISSVDVYPNKSDTDEESEINVNDIKNIYGQCKLICESYVKTHPNYLILRCGGIIGTNKIPNSIRSIVSSNTTTLTESSLVNYIAQDVILKIISTPNIQNETINVASSTSLILSDLLDVISPIKFGTYQYNIGNIKTNKLTSLFPNVIIPPSKSTLMKILNQIEFYKI